jgi:hypothetical protein
MADPQPLRRLAIRLMRNMRQRTTLIDMVAKDDAYLSQWSSRTQLDYYLHSNAQRIHVAPADGRTPWWAQMDRTVCDDGMEPALEIWLDDRAPPAIIRMTGVLDQSSKQSLLSLVDDLFGQGIRHFLVDAGDLQIGDASGANELTVFQRRTREAGGSLSWEGVDFGQPRRYVPHCSVHSSCDSLRKRQ